MVQATAHPSAGKNGMPNGAMKTGKLANRDWDITKNMQKIHFFVGPCNLNWQSTVYDMVLKLFVNKQLVLMKLWGFPYLTCRAAG
jgi:hypothetical protein